MLDGTAATGIKVYRLLFVEGFIFDIPERLVVTLRNKYLSHFPGFEQFV